MTTVAAARIVVGAVLMVSAAAAAAQEADHLLFNVGITRQHDNNLFRRPSDGSLGVVAADSRTTTQAGFSVRKPYSLQVFELSATIIDNRYDNFGTLNSRNDQTRAAWRWQLTPRLTGDLSADRSQALIDFADYRGTGQNIRTTEARRFSANWNIFGGWSLGAGATNTKLTNSQPFTQDDSNEQQTADVSLKYAFPSGASLELITSVTDGEYNRARNPVTQSDNKFVLHREDLKLSWPITGKTSLAAAYGRTSRKNEVFSARDYTSPNASLNLTWAATGRLNFTLSQARTTENWEDTASSYSLRDTTTLSGRWQITGKTALRASVIRESRAFRGFAVIPTATSRLDRTDQNLLALEWAAMQKLTIAASIQDSQRSSNTPGLDYNSRITSVSANASF